MKNKLNRIIVLAFAATLLFAVSASAESLEGYFGYAPNDKDQGEWLKVTAEEYFDIGVQFTINSTLASNKIHDGQFFFYFTQGVFDDVLESNWKWKTGDPGWINGAGWNYPSEYSVLAPSDTWKFDGDLVTFTLLYAAGKDWESFYTAAFSDPALTIAMHVQATPNGNSSRMMIATWTGGVGFLDCEDNPELCSQPCDLLAGNCDGSEVPEPSAILLLGTGIAGIGLIARRKLNKK